MIAPPPDLNRVKKMLENSMKRNVIKGNQVSEGKVEILMFVLLPVMFAPQANLKTIVFHAIEKLLILLILLTLLVTGLGGRALKKITPGTHIKSKHPGPNRVNSAPYKH